MAKTRREKLDEALLTAMSFHPDPAVAMRRQERLPKLIFAWQQELGHTECPRCNQRDCQLTQDAVSYRAGLKDKTARICALCLVEVNADRLGRVPVYTKR